jgi:hypothetical protein
MRPHTLAPTTHTTELHQVREINDALATGRRRLTAGSIGAPGAVPRDSVLRSLEAEGPPSYPYVYGVFGEPGSGHAARVELHTKQLRATSEQLSLRSHGWGL